MKRVNLKTKACGPNGNFNPGVHALDDGFADALIAAGHATLIESPVKKIVEAAAMTPAAETASMPAPRGRRPAKAGEEA